MQDRNNSRERDDFWDLDKLVPKKRATLSPFATEGSTREYTVPPAAVTLEGENTERGTADRRLNLDALGVKRGVKTSESLTYYPEGGLIKSVTVHHFIDRYDFYDNFRKSAEIFFDYRTERCEFAQFYSYMPQYSQLTREQKNYYFYWRDEIRHGRYIRTDYSYVYLYVYEILNLPDRIPPEEGIRLLCRLWREYRQRLPRLDNYFSIWVQDYCLVHRLGCPMDEIGDFIFDIIAVSSFKEFYLSDIENTDRGSAALLAYFSDYDWRRGKYVCGVQGADASASENAKTFYTAHMEGVMSLVLRGIIPKITGGVDGAETVTLRRDAFPNSLCTHMVKRKLEIEYYPIAGAEGLRRGITAAVKHAENRLRALLGVKSRLAVRELPDEYREIIDYYFDAVTRRQKKEEARASAPEYERLYDAPREDMSFAGADEIERLSWDTTLRLVEGSEDDGEQQEEISALADEQSDASSVSMSNGMGEKDSSSENTYGLDSEELSFLRSIIREDGGYAADADSLAERVNEKFADGFGDVILEYGDDGYHLIEDYKEDITDWLWKIMK
ncbi:MAG: TerB N-terminal domain-containing protein [Clostridia bacterium]|nr:TerB N-terminal domain-containing protein [Clostridia bacterium]